MICKFSRTIHLVCWLGLLVVGCGPAGCRAVQPAGIPMVLEPSNHRRWQPGLSVLPRAEFDGDQVTVRNIRNNTYLTEHDLVLHHYDRTFDLDEVQTVDFFVVPFRSMPAVAHTFLSFGLEDGQYIAVSAEVRLEEHESYSPILGLMRKYELMYVVASERDVIRLRTRHRNADVYVYRTKATPEQARQLFVDVMRRANQLEVQPEFYDTLTNNCTSNIADHINRLFPNRVPYSVDVLLPGSSDRYAYNLGLLDTSLSFEETKRRAWVNGLAELYYDSPDFSKKIRR